MSLQNGSSHGLVLRLCPFSVPSKPKPQMDAKDRAGTVSPLLIPSHRGSCPPTPRAASRPRPAASLEILGLLSVCSSSVAQSEFWGVEMVYICFRIWKSKRSPTRGDGVELAGQGPACALSGGLQAHGVSRGRASNRIQDHGCKARWVSGI